MSAGRFSQTVYQAEYAVGAIHPIRVQPETITAVTAAPNAVSNAAPTELANNPISAVTSRGRRQRGLLPRQVALRLQEGESVTGYVPFSVTSIPALTPAFYNACTLGRTVNYLEAAWTVVGRSPELAQ